MSLLPKSIHRCRRYPTKFNSGRDIPEQGEIVLIEPNPRELRELSRFRVFEGKLWNSPTLIGRYLLVRNDREAALYELPLAE